MRRSVCVLVALGLVGCGSGDDDGRAGGVAGAGAGGSAGSSAGAAGSGGAAGGAGASGPTCAPGPGYHDPSDVSFTIESLSASVVDEEGAPAAEILAQVCGIDLCINAKTDAAGRVTVTPNSTLLKPAFKYGTGIDFARFAIPLPSMPTHDLGVVSTLRMPPLGEGVPLTTGVDVTSNGVVLFVEAGGRVKIDKLTYSEPDQQGFRAREVPLAGSSPAIDPGESLAMVFALSPHTTSFCPAATLTVPNTANLPAGSAVEFVLHGIEIEQEWAPYAGWATVSDGTVSADGDTISTAEGAGIPLLGLIGVRPK